MEITSNTNNPIKRKIKPAESPTLAAAYARNKVHPQATDLEEAVLGAVLLEKDALLTIIDVLKPESFYKEEHQHIFKACLQLNNRNEPVDILTVTEELRKHNLLESIGGPVKIARLTGKISSSAHIEYHSRIIAEKYIQRELIKISSYIQDEAFEAGTDAFDLLDKSQDSLFKLSEGNMNKQFETIKELVDKAVQEIKENANKKDGLTGVPSGFTELDRLTGGWQKATLNIVAARPGHGKTAFALALARNAAVDFNIPTVFFSLEMDAVQLVMRLVSMETELESQNLKKGNLQMHEWTQLNKKVNNLYESPLFIDDTPGLSISQFRAKTRRLKHEKNIQLIVIDYLQLMTVAEEAKMVREQVISSISRTLKLVSKELQVPIIALAQVSREMEKRGGSGAHKPMLSDLRESGAIEQDADMVMFVFRKEMFGMEFEEDGTPTKGTADIVVAKHRNGPTADVRLKYVNHLTKFMDPDGTYSSAPNNNGGYEPVSAIKPNYNFDQNNGQTTRTMPSKFNDDDDFKAGPSIEEESPF
jgi:replicative DNA helicase